MLNIYLYSEEAEDVYYQNKIIKEVYDLINNTDYDHYYFKKVYEVIRSIKNKKMKLEMVKRIYHKAPKGYKNFWKLKNLKIRLKNSLGL